MAKVQESGTLYLCATPIGNLEDITLRVLRVLGEVDLIAAEDTRRTRKLLSFYNHHTPITSYNEYNHKQKSGYILGLIKKGKNIALVSDAGLPGISDPGEELVKQAILEGINVTSLPGPNAALTALVISGLPAGSFVFEGFLPAARKAKIEKLKKISKEHRTILFYEAPHRLRETLVELFRNFGNRKIVVARELTKKFEEVLRGDIKEIIEYFVINEPRGEFTLVVQGADEGADKEDRICCDISLYEHVAQLEAEGVHRKEAIKKVARLRGVPKREVYKEFLQGKDK